MIEKILLIGSGFIGNKLVPKLAERGYGVVVISIETGHDITDRTQVLDVVQNFPGKKIVLMAAVADLNVFEANPAFGLDVNVGGFINVALACSLHNKKLYFISTCCVYGNTPDLPSSENSSARPAEIYASSKLASECIIDGLNKSYGLEYVILRIATTYGPTMRGALAPAVFIDQVRRGQPITLHGDGTQTRTMTYIDDEVEGIASVINSAAHNTIVNISTQEELSVLEMARVIAEEMGRPDHPIVFIADRETQTRKEQIDASKAYALCGWKAKWTFREGIRETLRWMECESPCEE
jgi:UDP-glucose 4-epimerase